MRILVDARGLRRLQGLPRFQNAAQLSTAARRHLLRLKLRDDEVCLGVYLSEPPDFETTVAVTTQALHVMRGEGWLVLDYDQIDFVEVPRDERQAGCLMVHMHDRSTHRVRLSASRQYAQDVHAFALFLDLAREMKARIEQNDANAA